MRHGLIEFLVWVNCEPRSFITDIIDLHNTFSLKAWMYVFYCIYIIIFYILQHSTVSLVVTGSKSAQNRWHSFIWCTLFISTAWLWACSPALELQYIFCKNSGFSRFINRWLECRMHPWEEICCPFSPCHYLCLTGPDADVTMLAYLNNISCFLHCKNVGLKLDANAISGVTASSLYKHISERMLLWSLVLQRL